MFQKTRSDANLCERRSFARIMGGHTAAKARLVRSIARLVPDRRGRNTQVRSLAGESVVFHASDDVRLKGELKLKAA